MLDWHHQANKAEEEISGIHLCSVCAVAFRSEYELELRTQYTALNEPSVPAADWAHVLLAQLQAGWRLKRMDEETYFIMGMALRRVEWVWVMPSLQPLTCTKCHFLIINQFSNKHYQWYQELNKMTKMLRALTRGPQLKVSKSKSNFW